MGIITGCCKGRIFAGRSSRGDSVISSIQLNETLRHRRTKTRASPQNRSLMGSSHSNSLNINNCSVDELLSLKGIGQCIAKRIMEQRAVCAFDSADDFVQRVEGVGLISWRRISAQNEVNIVFGAQTPWFTGPPKWITGEMSQRCRGKLILPYGSKSSC